MIKKALASSQPGERQEYFSTLLRLSIPVILQNLMHSSVNLADTVMVGQLGDVSIAGVGLANQFFFILNLIMFGVASGMSVFISQFWGKRDLDGIHRTMALGLWIVVPLMLAATALTTTIPQQILRMFTPDTVVLAEGGQYLRIAGLSYIVSSVTMIYAFAARGTEQVRYPFITTVIALFINVTLNYLLIFGIGPFPEMGVRGAAVATLISRLVEFAVLIGLVYYNKLPVAMKLKDMLAVKLTFVKRFVSTSGFVFVTESLWGICSTAFFAIYGRMGTEVVAAVNISKTIENFVLVFFWGVASATGITVGRLVGAEEYDKARRFAIRFIITGVATGIVLGVVLYLISNPILSLFDVSQTVVDISIKYLGLFVLFLWVRGTSAVATVGVLRSGGDTAFAMWTDLIPFAIVLPLASILGLVLKMPPWTVFITVMAYDLLRFTPAVIRIAGNRWMKNVVNE